MWAVRRLFFVLVMRLVSPLGLTIALMSKSRGLHDAIIKGDANQTRRD